MAVRQVLAMYGEAVTPFFVHKQGVDFPLKLQVTSSRVLDEEMFWETVNADMHLTTDQCQQSQFLQGGHGHPRAKGGSELKNVYSKRHTHTFILCTNIKGHVLQLMSRKTRFLDVHDFAEMLGPNDRIVAIFGQGSRNPDERSNLAAIEVVFRKGV